MCRGVGGWVEGAANAVLALGACYTLYNIESMQVWCLMCMVMCMEILILCLDDWSFSFAAYYLFVIHLDEHVQ